MYADLVGLDLDDEEIGNNHDMLIDHAIRSHERMNTTRWDRFLYGVEDAAKHPVWAAVAAEQATGGIVVTVGSFTGEAEEFANLPRVAVELIDGDMLQRMMGDVPGQRAAGAEGGVDSAMENMLCPRCGSALVLRTARRGPNRGSRFHGCSSYPRCRFTQAC